MKKNKKVEVKQQLGAVVTGTIAEKITIKDTPVSAFGGKGERPFAAVPKR